GRGPARCTTCPGHDVEYPGPYKHVAIHVRASPSAVWASYRTAVRIIEARAVPQPSHPGRHTGDIRIWRHSRSGRLRRAVRPSSPSAWSTPAVGTCIYHLPTLSSLGEDNFPGNADRGTPR